ncbi:hypothetical protein PMAYCL1PPCAC_21622 [Pristionchus mayeri]|uniref:Uncharacterized protein n=1 Tax=Pristionchus mayeri TaxID=1317129 RepID=A0AAN5CWN6_9BILA|nr:hypothetical protein PMAYCL1PPCAC_21622 [Pristionchus mayeri]
MALTRRVIALAVFLQIAVAFVQFNKSRLYDETDFSILTVSIPPHSFCQFGCRMYVSVPESSAAIAKRIEVHDHRNEDVTNLYAISLLKKGDQKGYFDVEDDDVDLSFHNTNPRTATAPLAVWLVRKYDSDNNVIAIVYEAADLNTAPISTQVITVMSAAPFTLRTKTDGPTRFLSGLTGFDAFTNEEDACVNVLEQDDENALADMEVNVYSPLISIYYALDDFPDTNTAFTAVVGIEKLDFSGLSFAASPGFIGCLSGEQYYSSLYPSTVSFEYTSSRAYDVNITSQVINTDVSNPVIVTDITNDVYKWFENYYNDEITLQQTNNLIISWTRDDPDQQFLVRLTPRNEQRLETTLGTDPTTDVVAVTSTELSVRPSTESTTHTSNSKTDNTATTTRPTSRPTTPTDHPKYVSTSTKNLQTVTTMTSNPTTSGAVRYGDWNIPDFSYFTFQDQRSLH